MQKALLILSLFLLASCGESYRNVSEFHIKPTALKDGERIKLLFALIGNSNNQKDKYYNQLIAISQESGDTVNILVPFDHGLTQTDGDRTFNYFSPESQGAKLISADPEKITTLTNIDSVESEFPKYNKVIYNSKFEHWINNNHSTVFGIIGTQN